LWPTLLFASVSMAVLNGIPPWGGGNFISPSGLFKAWLLAGRRGRRSRFPTSSLGKHV